MSELAPQPQYSGYTFPFQTVDEVGLREDNNIFKSPLVQALEEDRIAQVPVSLSKDDFGAIADLFQACLANCPEVLKTTYHAVDRRYGNEAGFVRKDRKIDARTKRQTQDPKNLFHFNEQAMLRWNEEFRIAPAELRQFLEAGYEIHNALLGIARTAIVASLEPTYPGITNAFFPANNPSVSFYRHVDYDDYYITDEVLIDTPVAKPHVDIGAYTLQANATAPGFYAKTPDGKRYFDEHEGQGYVFAGATHAKIYGINSLIKPLVHGVDRIIPENASYIPRRQADILFTDPWKIDANIKPADTEAY